jgi:hypothetical protein
MSTTEPTATPRVYVDLAKLTPQTLGELGELEWRFVVDADLRRNAHSKNIRRQDVPQWISDALRSREHVERWVGALRAMLSSVDGQLARRRAAGESREDVAKTLRFRAALREALPEAEALLGGRIQELERAIRTHRDATTADETIAPSEIDFTLWSVLDNTERRTNTNYETDARSPARPESDR